LLRAGVRAIVLLLGAELGGSKSMLIGLSPLVLAAAVVATAAEDLPRIVVQGSGSAETPANVAALSYDVVGEGKTSDEAVRSLVAKSAAVENALKAVDPALKLETQSMRVEGVRGNECKDDEYGETLRLSTGKCAIVGYVAEQDFDVRSGAVSDAGTMVGVAGRYGAANPKIDSFELSDPRAARQRAITAALADARAKAQAIAAGSNGVLGKVLTVSLDGAAMPTIGQSEIVLRQVNAREEMVVDRSIRVVVTPGPVRTIATVTVSYELRR
jgi:uncharacterized protein YggE